jgi:KDO2-lipid IV(A) lauroyltransferase
MVKRNFEALGISFFETANAYYASDNKIKKALTIENEYFFTDALKKRVALYCYVHTLCH